MPLTQWSNFLLISQLLDGKWRTSRRSRFPFFIIIILLMGFQKNFRSGEDASELGKRFPLFTNENFKENVRLFDFKGVWALRLCLLRGSCLGAVAIPKERYMSRRSEEFLRRNLSEKVTEWERCLLACVWRVEGWNLQSKSQVKNSWEIFLREFEMLCLWKVAEENSQKWLMRNQNPFDRGSLKYLSNWSKSIFQTEYSIPACINP